MVPQESGGDEAEREIRRLRPRQRAFQDADIHKERPLHQEDSHSLHRHCSWPSRHQRGPHPGRRQCLADGVCDQRHGEPAQVVRLQRIHEGAK